MPARIEVISGGPARSHLQAVAALQHVVTSELAGLSPAGFGAGLRASPALDEVREQLDASLDEGSELLVALVDGAFAGFLLGFTEGHADDLVSAPYMTVEYLAVLPAFRGCGIAHNLLGAAEAQAISHGCTALELRVMANNQAAISAYERYGFELLELRYARLLNGMASLDAAES